MFDGITRIVSPWTEQEVGGKRFIYHEKDIRKTFEIMIKQGYYRKEKIIDLFQKDVYRYERNWEKIPFDDRSIKLKHLNEYELRKLVDDLADEIGGWDKIKEFYENYEQKEFERKENIIKEKIAKFKETKSVFHLRSAVDYAISFFSEEDEDKSKIVKYLRRVYENYNVLIIRDSKVLLKDILEKYDGYAREYYVALVPKQHKLEDITGGKILLRKICRVLVGPYKNCAFILHRKNNHTQKFLEELGAKVLQVGGQMLVYIKTDKSEPRMYSFEFEIPQLIGKGGKHIKKIVQKVGPISLTKV